MSCIPASLNLLEVGKLNRQRDIGHSLYHVSDRHYAFAGVHNLSPRIFPHFAQWGFTGRFPIMDFYLKTCAAEPIYGLLAKDLTLVDVGKFDQLEQAEKCCKMLL